MLFCQSRSSSYHNVWAESTIRVNKSKSLKSVSLSIKRIMSEIRKKVDAVHELLTSLSM